MRVRGGILAHLQAVYQLYLVFKVIVALNTDHVNAAESRNMAGVTTENPFLRFSVSGVEMQLGCNLAYVN